MIEIQNIIFYNCGNNGDVHYSRNFIKHLLQNISIKSEYQIKCHPSILKDLKNIDIVPFKFHEFIQNEIVYIEDQKILLINTWVGSSNAKFILNEIGCSLTANYEKYKNIYSNLGLPLLDPVEYIPEIDWSVCNTNTIDNFFITNKFDKTVLICNGAVLSGQSNNFDFNPVVSQLSEVNPKVAFILTNSDNKIYHKNVFYTSDIIKTEGSDLNEIGYVGTKSDIIVGRGSGPFCFCHNKTILLDPSKTFLALTNYKTDGWWASPEQMPEKQAKQLWCKQFDYHVIYDIIQKEISK